MINSYFLIGYQGSQKQGSDIFNVWKAKLLMKNIITSKLKRMKEKICPALKQKKLKGFITSRTVLHEMLKKVFPAVIKRH